MSHTQLPLTALRSFEAAARLLSFKSAAAELRVTPTAISHQIQQLERFLGADLFVRVHRGLVLTPAGRSCLPHIRSGFTSLRAAVDAARQHKDSRLLTISAPPSFAMRVLMPLTHDFLADHPDIDLRVTTRMCEPAPAATSSQDEADIFWRWTEESDVVIVLAQGGFGALDAEILLPLSIELVCSPKLAHAGLNHFQDVARFPWLHDDRGLKYGCGSFWAQWLSHAGLELQDQGQGGHYMHASLAIDAAVRGDGLLITTPCLCWKELQNGELISPFRLHVSVGNSYFLLGRRTNRITVGLFRNWLQSAVRKTALR